MRYWPKYISFQTVIVWVGLWHWDSEHGGNMWSLQWVTAVHCVTTPQHHNQNPIPMKTQRIWFYCVVNSFSWAVFMLPQVESCKCFRIVKIRLRKLFDGPTRPTLCRLLNMSMKPTNMIPLLMAKGVCKQIPIQAGPTRVQVVEM
jgi:hypothetical protein